MKGTIVFLLIFLAAVTASFASVQEPHSVSIGTFSTFFPKIETIKKELKPDAVAFVGDIMLARRVETYLDTYGGSYVYSGLPNLGTSTLLVGNFEASIPAEHTQTLDQVLNFSVDAEYIPALAEYGFSYVSLANNHSYDKGSDGFLNTQSVLTQNDVYPFGNPQKLGTSSIVYIELENMTVALVGVYAVVQQPSHEEIQVVLNIASAESDLQVVYIHWGLEYEPEHSKAQETLAHTMIDLGADAVIGHHPHVVQDIELYQGVPIFYSLGNFIFDQYFSKEVQEGLWVTLSNTEGNINYILQGVSTIGSRSAPRFMSGYENDLFLQDIAKKSSPELQDMILDGKIVY